MINLQSVHSTLFLLGPDDLLTIDEQPGLVHHLKLGSKSTSILVLNFKYFVNSSSVANALISS